MEESGYNLDLGANRVLWATRSELVGKSNHFRPIYLTPLKNAMCETQI